MVDYCLGKYSRIVYLFSLIGLTGFIIMGGEQGLLSAEIEETTLIHPSESQFVKGEKWPNSAMEGDHPVIDWAPLVTEKQQKEGFTELLPYVLPTPDQKDAGSCLYMSHTGIAEWWLNRLHPEMGGQSEGEFDLSERYTMNLISQGVGREVIRNWKTDSIFVFNAHGKSVRNKDYRYTKGYFVQNKQGRYIRSDASNPYAKYGTLYNWINESQNYNGPFQNLPVFKRRVLFADPEGNQWNVGVAPENIVEMVKEALVTKKAPINVIYNHHGFWHSVILLGFNDHALSNECSFVRSHIQHQFKQAEEYREKSLRAISERQKEQYRQLAQNIERGAHKAQNSFFRTGCRNQGIFYVRDSIYSDPKEKLYDYDLKQKGDEAPYSARIIAREYEWLEVLANHVIQVYVE